MLTIIAALEAGAETLESYVADREETVRKSRAPVNSWGKLSAEKKLPPTS